MKKSAIAIFLALIFPVKLLAVEFNVVYQDNEHGDFEARGWLDESSLFQRNINAALRLWSARIDSNNTIEVLVRPDRAALRAGGGSTWGRMAFETGDGGLAWEPGPLTRVLTGDNPGFRESTPYDVELIFDAEFIENDYWFDPEPGTRLTEPETTKTDLVWVVMHEMGHALGMNGFRNWSISGDTEHGLFKNEDRSVFDTFTYFDGDGNPYTLNDDVNPLLFDGSSVVSLYGGPTPLQHHHRNSGNAAGNFYHFGDCNSAEVLRESLMRGCYSPMGRGAHNTD